MKKKIILFLTVLMVWASTKTVHAGIPPIDTTADVSLTLQFGEDFNAPGMPVRIYRVADMDEYASFSLLPEYADSGVDLNDADQEKWQEISSVLDAYVIASDISADGKSVVSSEHLCEFTGLQQGLYLVVADPYEYEQVRYTVQSGLISLPYGEPDPNDREEWIYDVVMNPKWSSVPIEPEYDELDFCVKKVWAGDDKEKRPAEVTVTIIKDNEVFDTVVLNSDNNWNYQWKGLDDGSVYKVLEVKVPEGYSVSVNQDKTLITVKNTYQKPNPNTPPTSDENHVSRAMMGLIGAGVVILAAGLMLRRGKEEE